MRHPILITSLLALLGVASLASAASAAPPVSSQAAHRALETALDALSGPETLSAGPATGSREATTALRDLAVALPALHGADRRRALDLLARPTDKSDRAYFGREAPRSPTCDARFCVHWTNKKANRPESRAFLSAIVESVGRSRNIENGALGWRDPKPDGKLGSRHGRGASGQVDVYVTNLGSKLYGYATTDSHQRGSRRHAYLVLDNDYTGFPSGPLKSMRVTVAHEYNHILQFNYDVHEDSWLFEDTATWMEEKVYPKIDDYLNYLSEFTEHPSRPMTGSTTRIYAEAVWNHWLGARYGDDVIRDVWRVSPKQRSFAVDSYDEAIKDAGGGGFAPELGEFFAATAEWRAQPAFPDRAAYPNVDRFGTLGGATKKVKLDNTSFGLYDVHAPGSDPVTLSVEAEEGTRSSISLVARQGPETSGTVTAVTRYLPKGGDGDVSLPNPGTYSRITAVVANVDGRSDRRDRRGERVYRSDGSTYRLALG